ncbi:hypothetical protein M3Y94_00798500 [Aphelenchoides besseyi]|nr:hypothetical protein M3Y94_00798500 [Aphelenchoides besseyi]KAI6232513.1 hypothetical protein M3Y95_00493800 [Aphelenchoides besseyi]
MKLSICILLLWTYGLFIPTSVDSCAATSTHSEPEIPPTTTTTTTVEPINDCGTTCQPLQEKRDSNDSQAVTQTPIDDAGNGCSGFTQMCQGQDAESAVIITYYNENGDDVSSAFGTGSLTTMVACNAENMLTYNGTTVSQIECIVA